MYAWLNGKEILAMMDTSVTHNFIAQREVVTFGLRLTENLSKLKTINSEVMPVHGRVETSLKVDLWEGQVSLMAVPLDDFDIIIGNEFFINANVALISYLNGMQILDQKTTCFVSAVLIDQGKMVGKWKIEMLSSMQVNSGLQRRK